MTGLLLSEEQAAKIHRAAKLLQEDGIEAIESAAKIVGEDVALAMLVLFVRIGIAGQGRYPIDSSLEDTANEFLRQNGHLNQPVLT